MTKGKNRFLHHRKSFFLAGFTFYSTALCRSHMAICERHNCFIILKTNFWDFEFVFGAKVIYFSWRIQIRKTFWRARISARAARHPLKKAPKLHMGNFDVMKHLYWRAVCALRRARTQNCHEWIYLSKMHRLDTLIVYSALELIILCFDEVEEFSPKSHIFFKMP